MMKLYVWCDPYPVSYGTSMVFAIADTIENGKKIAATGPGYSFGYLDDDTPNVELGEPTRIVELPCAEWHFWEE